MARVRPISNSLAEMALHEMVYKLTFDSQYMTGNNPDITDAVKAFTD